MLDVNTSHVVEERAIPTINGDCLGCAVFLTNVGAFAHEKDKQTHRDVSNEEEEECDEFKTVVISIIQERTNLCSIYNKHSWRVNYFSAILALQLQ